MKGKYNKFVIKTNMHVRLFDAKSKNIIAESMGRRFVCSVEMVFVANVTFKQLVFPGAVAELHEGVRPRSRKRLLCNTSLHHQALHRFIKFPISDGIVPASSLPEIAKYSRCSQRLYSGG